MGKKYTSDGAIAPTFADSSSLTNKDINNLQRTTKEGVFAAIDAGRLDELAALASISVGASVK